MSNPKTTVGVMLHYINERIDTGFVATVVPALVFLVIFASATKKSNVIARRRRSPTPEEPNNNHVSNNDVWKDSSGRIHVDKKTSKEDNINSADVDELLSHPQSAKQRARTMRMDQIVFTGSIVNLGVMMYWMGQWPQYFWMWHMVNAVVLISIRWYVFKQDNQHYFLYDFCYWANLYSIVYVTISSQNHIMFQVLFMVSNGPLAWSIPAFSSRAVFHNLQQMTTIFIHFSPMALTFCLRWTKSVNFSICQNGEVDFKSCDDLSATYLVLLAISRLYIWWMVIYYFWVFILLDKRVKRKGYMTLFTWMAQTQVMGDIMRAVSPSEVIQKAVYLLGHYVFALVTMVFATVLWKNFYLHLVFILCIGTFAAWNGAGYYLNTFSTRYEKEVEEKVRKQLAALRSPSAPPIRRKSVAGSLPRSSSSLR
eukprot:TRINITY_DN79436_c0_g1_i1.p1 TRINITY_DN79436_c0_g1~~TRINITY_DN79436_c0_g1_i1.p1  ORF type:complete len:424 (-),score=80.15 TRINITY_DN79436_c0_g1_i1:75-1346(-)